MKEDTPRGAVQTVRLRLGDCMDVMKSMQPHSVQAVVCDPPYG